jgi:hypothetical protein
MPGSVVQAGLANDVLPLDRMAERLNLSTAAIPANKPGESPWTSDPELLDLFFAETAANVGGGPTGSRLVDRGTSLPGDLAGVARAFHTLAGTAGLVGHAAWGRFAAATPNV